MIETHPDGFSDTVYCISDDMHELLCQINTVVVPYHTYSVLAEGGNVVYGNLRLFPPPNTEFTRAVMRDRPSNQAFALWEGECFANVTADYEESMLTFVKGMHFHTFGGADKQSIDRYVHHLSNLRNYLRTPAATEEDFKEAARMFEERKFL
jgi:hypothetical protein